MTGGSLGLRSASYGSLQQQQQQQQQLNGAALPTQSPPISVRKSSKMSLSSAREKERFLPWIFKIAGRRKVGMLLLLVVSVAVLSFVSLVSKDEHTSATSEIHPGFRKELINPERTSVFKPKVTKDNVINASVDSYQQYTRVDNLARPPILVLPPSTTFAHHPCENFTFAPPPVDKKRTGPRPCPVCYVPVEQAVALMPSSLSESPVLKNLSYLLEENLISNESNMGSNFGGHPSLQQRNESFDIKETMSVHCGFVRGKKPGLGSGFDIDDADLLEMEGCHGVVVASAIFGNYDIMQQPKNISEYAKKNACFYMFVDKETEAYIKNTNSLDDTKRVGLWRVVVVRNLPYTDARRTGKVPKLLLHRLFPNVRYSLWIDGKLELVVDPYQILERFLWRTNSTFAISRHYRRFDVFEEAEANKAAGKYDNASIDRQIEFYKEEGLTHYTSAKLPITSDVPEGCVIIREHIPITNLFTCLWFNEVDRFTSRDQISFSTVRDKIMTRVNWRINMFMDCERRNFVIQAYHRELLIQRNSHVSSSDQLPPPAATDKTTPEKLAKPPPLRKLPGKISMRRGKEKKPGSRRRHPRPVAGRESNSI